MRGCQKWQSGKVAERRGALPCVASSLRRPVAAPAFTLFEAMLAVALVAGLSGGVFAFLLNASGALIVYIYIAIAFAQIRVRRQAEREGRPLPLRMWLFPWLTYFAIAGMTAVLVAMAITPARAVEFWTSAVSVAVALVAYAVVRRRRGS